MNMQFVKILGLSLSLGILAPMGFAASLDNSAVKTSGITTAPSPLIEKALNQQKRNVSALGNDNDLIMLNSLRVTASQNFFATQHQRFSRFVQSLFQPHSS
ncbi:DUF4179 domain-containing protein [uncultured Acinetobacter sp.]|uniref:DUF4179 domain-containing protein n=1 Tax=uncultured Acinetobacter sp. TaxID=165433 RepID=UPI00258E4BD3|nr:DUF4179 domain-containing protein [uncultured Acinetobacter sp.]